MYMKKFLLILSIIFITFGCKRVDGILFKEDFEKENYNTKIKVSIPSNNPMTYITEEDLIKKIENKEDIIVLFGYSKSIETRSMIENLISIAKDNNIKTIYYLDILEIRDEKTLENDEIKTTKNGTEDYNKLVELLKDNLEDYKINNQSVGKRIYSGTILKISNKNISIIRGISDNFNINNYNDDMKKESYDKINNFLNNNSCNPNEGC